MIYTQVVFVTTTELLLAGIGLAWVITHVMKPMVETTVLIAAFILGRVIKRAPGFIKATFRILKGIAGLLIYAVYSLKIRRYPNGYRASLKY